MYAYLSIATVRKVLRYLVENIKYFVGALVLWWKFVEYL